MVYLGVELSYINWNNGLNAYTPKIPQTKQEKKIYRYTFNQEIASGRDNVMADLRAKVQADMLPDYPDLLKIVLKQITKRKCGEKDSNLRRH